MNDSYFHGSIITIPFGGIGGSGMGAYRGRASFDAFTHRRSMAKTPAWVEPFIRVRYIPYLEPELKRIQRLNSGKPDFDRSGKQLQGVSYWLGFVLGIRPSRLSSLSSPPTFRASHGSYNLSFFVPLVLTTRDPGLSRPLKAPHFYPGPPQLSFRSPQCILTLYVSRVLL